MFLVDTDVLSEIRKPKTDAGVAAWMARQQTLDIYLSVVTIGEIERGIALCRGRDPVFASALETWLHRVLSLYASRILPFDLGAARRWGTLSAALGNQGPDLQIAATALEHGLTVVTRNVAHFLPTGVRALNPFTGP